MKKVDDGEKKKKKRKKKITAEIVANNVVASRPPEQRPTRTPTARANYDGSPYVVYLSYPPRPPQKQIQHLSIKKNTI